MVMNKLLIGLFLIISVSMTAQNSIYQFKIKTIDGGIFDFASLKGKKIMIVNTASKCGLTPQYQMLESLYEQYGGKNFVIIGFPANDFMEQEPGTDDEIRKFCTLNYNISFPMMAKISVKGENIAPIYQWLTQKILNGKFDSEVKWNFQKYLINEKGELDRVIDPKTNPTDPQIIQWIE